VVEYALFGDTSETAAGSFCASLREGILVEVASNGVGVSSLLSGGLSRSPNLAG
jgi:hypothetical protein